jgi:hypothetical protein
MLLSSRNKCYESEESLGEEMRPECLVSVHLLKFRGYLFQWFTCCYRDDKC